jgi:hypothetical protein
VNKVKPTIAFIFLILPCVSVAFVEYVLMRFGILSSALVSGSFVLLLIALLRAPEGYEDENGFHFSTPTARAPHMFAVSGFPS